MPPTLSFTSNEVIAVACPLVLLLGVLLLVRLLERAPRTARLFKIIPPLVFYYFLPTCLNMVGLIPRESPLYVWVKTYVLTASLCLLTLSLDVRAILRLGRTAAVVFATSSLSIMIGGPIALWIWKSSLPPDAWKAMAWLAGSWIGGAANAVALTSSFQVSDQSAAPLIVVDVIIAYAWMAVLLFLAARHRQVDRRLRADPAQCVALESRITSSPISLSRSSNWFWLVLISVLGLIIAFATKAGVAVWMCTRVGSAFKSALDESAWRVILATTVGVALSFTPARHLEVRGASRVGMSMLYLLVACIGAGADLSALRHAGGYLALGLTWMAIHIVILLAVGRLLRAPLFFLAVSSQANIGGPVSAPIVAAAFHPTLAPIGVLLAIAGYVVGTYLGLLCVHLCRLV